MTADDVEEAVDLCARARHRLFPAAPVDTPWATLLRATGRGSLPAHDPLGDDRTGDSAVRQ